METGRLQTSNKTPSSQDCTHLNTTHLHGEYQGRGGGEEIDRHTADITFSTAKRCSENVGDDVTVSINELLRYDRFNL